MYDVSLASGSIIHTLTHCDIRASSCVLGFFCKEINYMEYLRRKYVCRSAVPLIEAHSFEITFFPIPFSGGMG